MNAPFAHLQTVLSPAAPRTVLLLAWEFVSQYRVLRCAAITGTEVHVMGAGKSQALALSRYCTAYHCYAPFLGPHAALDPAAVAAEIDRIARNHGIDMVLACDAPMTRLLSSMQPFLNTRSFPVPPVAAFDMLATKDAFMTFCRARDLLHPAGQIFGTADALRAAVAAGQVRLPAIFKPLDRAGSIGVVRVDAANIAAVLARLDYAPILAQDFITGEDRSITVTARDGAVVKEAVYWHPDGVFRFGGEPALSAIVTDIVQELGLSGVYNFDARLGTDGRVWMIECNPRFFFNMDVAAVAGMNFAALNDVASGARVLLVHDDIRVPHAVVRDLLRGRWPSACDFKMLRHWLSDPFVFALVSLGYSRRWRLRLLEDFAAWFRRA